MIGRLTSATAVAALLVVSGSAGLAGATPPEPTEQRANCAIATGPAPTGPPAGHRLLDLDAAHRLGTGAGVRVAVIDTGVTPHPRLPRLVGGGDFVSDGDGLSDCDAHGTLVAGIIAGRPSPDDDFVGVAPAATVISIRQSSGAFSATSRTATSRTRDAAVVGAGYGPLETLAAAVDRAVDLGARVINISEVACTTPGDTAGDRVLSTALTRARHRDAVVVAAAGNLTETTGCREQNPAASIATAGIRTSVTPARLSPLVLAVGAVDAAGAPADFSLRGPWVGVAAPGTDVVSLAPGPGGARLVSALRTSTSSTPLAGTSYAAPYVSGLAALIRGRYPRASAAEVIDRIVSTAHGGGHDAAVGSGVIDLVAALTTDPSAVDAPIESGARHIAMPASEPSPDSGLGLIVAAAALAGSLLLGAWLVLRQRTL